MDDRLQRRAQSPAKARRFPLHNQLQFAACSDGFGAGQDFWACEYAITVVTAHCVAEMNCAMASPLSFGKAMKPAKIADVARTKTTFCGKVRIGRLCRSFIDQL
jgi:hypothetical protein